MIQIGLLYLVWRVREKRLLWFVLEDDDYRPLEPGSDGLWRGRIFPGLALNARASLDGDLARVLADQQQSLSQPEHGHFVETLRRV